MAEPDIILGVGVNTKKAVSSIRAFRDKVERSFAGIALATTGINQGVNLLGIGFRALTKTFDDTIGAAFEFSESLAEIQTLLKDDEISTAKLGKTVLSLQRQFGGKQKDIATGYYDAISSGAVQAANAQQFLEDANRLAIGGVTDITTAVDGLTTIISAFGTSADDSKKISDTMFIAMKRGKKRPVFFI